MQSGSLTWDACGVEDGEAEKGEGGMRFLTLCVTAMLGCSCSTQIDGQQKRTSSERQLDVTNSDAGTIVTNLGYNIQVNKGSSLHRQSHIINDPSWHVKISSSAISTKYASSAYRFIQDGRATTTGDLTAIEVVSALFDIWGDHMKNLRAASVTDHKAQDIPLAEAGAYWYLRILIGCNVCSGSQNGGR